MNFVIFATGAIFGIGVSMIIDIIDAKRKAKKTKDVENLEIRDNTEN